MSVATRLPSLRAPLELAAVAATAGVHLALHDHPRAHLVFVVAAITGWLGYVGWSIVREPERVGAWGLGREGLVESTALTLPIAIVTAGGLVAWGRLQGVGLDPWLLLPLALYPIWGVVQQLLVQGMLVRNLDDVGAPNWLIVGVAALGFGLVHWPYPVLMGATLLLGLVFTPIYLRFRNVWALGLWHGWLGTLLYQFVLQRHPIHEALGIG